MKTITIREAYDWLHLGEHINQTEWDEILLYIQGRYMSFVEIGYGKIRWINLVGVIQLSTVRIEILPKLSIDQTSEENNREALLNMLNVTKNLPVSLNESTLSELAKADLLHIFAQVYIQLLLKEVRRGVFKEYKLKQENSLTLKGRFLLDEHVKRNAFQPVKAYCEFDELQEDVLLNQILKRALKVMLPYLTKGSLKTETLYLMDTFQHVTDVQIQKNQLDNVTFHRQNRRFEQVFNLAKMILSNDMMTSKFSNQKSFSLLFEMNQLFEYYIESAFRFVAHGRDIEVQTQHDKKRLLINVHSGQENIKLKPDFVITRKGAQMIVDTKWKSIIHKGRLQYQQSDLYQMYAYITSYEASDKCVLLYPKTEEAHFPKWQVPKQEKYIEIFTVRLSSLRETMDDLVILLE
ncbi:McrC family protein [Bacillus sp. FJAT-47783]|uniref:McrC family protein n=1 Tax=Bacillus sp. FJAT-47783 TaxID=2922712 RepID=UPI001FADDE32|nr:McrC family protein [Bacillus sp. FJAT-47783]